MNFPRRRGMSFLELLIGLAIISVLVGVVSPMIQNEIRKARSVRTANEMEKLQKLLVQDASKRGLLQPLIPDTPYSPPGFLRPDQEVKLSSLIPRSLAEIPKDAWGDEIYRYGNYLMSNGDNGIPGDDDDVAFKVAEFPDQVDPDTGTLLMSRLEAEAVYQTEYLALQVQKYAKDLGSPPNSLWDVYQDGREGSPADPWGNRYELIDEPGQKLVASLGPDQSKGTEDDIVAAWDSPTSYEDSFLLGIRNWVKVFPLDASPATTRIRWVDAGGPTSRLRFDGNQGGVQSAAWAKVPPATVDMSPYQRVSVTVNATRSQGPFIWGVFVNYMGKNSGFRGTMVLEEPDGDALLFLDTSAPGLGRTWKGTTPPQAFAGIEVSSNTWQFQGTLEVIPASPPRVRFRVTGGGHDGVVTQELTAAPKAPGAVGVFVATRPPGGKFVADFDNLVVERLD